MLARKKFLGNYQLIKTIGQGAFSKVKLGIHKETGQKVAIKIIDKKEMAVKTEKAKKAAEDRERKRKHHKPPPPAADAKPASSPNSPPPTERAADPRGEVSDAAATPAKPRPDKKGTEVTTGPSAATGDGAGAPPFMSTVQLEVQLLMRLDHPNVINLYQVMETEDECFVVMEFAAGGELIEYIASRNYLTEKEARRLFRQIISAMDHCHLANVVHRDLKLENLLLTEQKNILISDFGLGRTFLNDKDDYMKTFCGTPNYAAVELISGIPYIGVKSDIWAMGVVLYVMMTGRPPFSGDNISALYGKIKAVDYKCPDYFSKDPKSRIDMAGLRNDPWVNFEESEPPPRLIPKITGTPDPSNISQFIKSITHDASGITFTIRQYMRDGTNIDGAGVEKNQTLQRTMASGRRRSYSFAPPGSAEKVVVKPPGEKIGEDGEDEVVSDLPKQAVYVPPPIQRRRRMSMQDPPTSRPVIMSESPASPPPLRGMDTASPPPLDDGYVAPTPAGQGRQRRNTISLLFANNAHHALEEPRPRGSFDERSAASSTSGVSAVGQSFATLSNRTSVAAVPAAPATSPNPNQHRRSSVSTVTGDRSMSLMRRMSMVSPPMERRSVSVSPTQSAAKSATSGSSGTRISSEKNSHEGDVDRGGTSYQLSEGLESVSSKIDASGNRTSMLSAAVGEVAGDSAMDIVPSKEEIEGWHEMHYPPKEIRAVRYSFNPSLTSTLPPSVIFQDVHRVLILLQRLYDDRLQFKRETDYYLLKCRVREPNQDNDVDFEVEVCKIWLLKLHGVRIKRISGSALVFKDIYSNICDSLNIR
ncbi:Map microtubule affinity-regulating kinase [Irineochytrium annulatum]|nr:Map microtubule affinity-regulating kinase [Irineochytrium annulatum]